MQLQELSARLGDFVADEYSGASLENIHESDGHAGLTFLFDVCSSKHETQGFVIKMPPKGVAYRGNTDVYRQGVLLRALHKKGLMVPAVPHAYEDNAWFETPFIIMQRLAGAVFFIWDPLANFSRDVKESRAVWQQCAAQLPAIHRFDWRSELKDWDTPEPLAKNIQRWRRIYQQSPEPDWLKAAERIEQMLLDSMPKNDPIGLFHGDYQPGNVLYHNGKISGIIDWELAGIGSQLLDVGWLMMVCDQNNWVPQWCPIHPLLPGEIKTNYERSMGQDYPQLHWFQAFAGYRLGSIGCLNVKLHRQGQRHDPVWEKIGACVPKLFHRAEVLLGQLD